MKKYALPFFTIIIAFGMLMVSCSTDEDEDIDNGDDRDKFIGTWSVNETCSKRIYSVVISADPNNSSRVFIQNFADPGTGDPAVGIVANNHIEIDPNHKIGDNWTVTGDGTLVNDKRMEWTYSLIISGSEQNCTAIYSR